MRLTDIIVLVAAGSAWMDIRYGRIRNAWLVFCLAGGFAARLQLEGISGLVHATSGFLLPALLLGGLFIPRMLGAGDIKLFMVLGVYMGAGAIFRCLWVSMAFGAILSAGILLETDLVFDRFVYFVHYIQAMKRTRQILPYRQKGTTRLENYPFTIPILVSVLLYAAGIYS